MPFSACSFFGPNFFRGRIFPCSTIRLAKQNFRTYLQALAGCEGFDDFCVSAFEDIECI
jgi:hypothetical protein